MNIQDNKEYNALMKASKHGHKDCIKALLEAGASVNTATTFDCTALIMAAASNDISSVRLLLESGAYVNHTTINGISGIQYSMLIRGACDEQDGTAFGNKKKKQEEIITLMFGAGEMFKRSFVGKFVESEFCLKVTCRDTIRKHLLDLNSHEHLFNRIPRLELPHSLSDYLLYHMSLDDD